MRWMKNGPNKANKMGEEGLITTYRILNSTRIHQNQFALHQDSFKFAAILKLSAPL